MELQQQKQWLKNYSERLIEEAPMLNALDTPIGDGDHGSNMAKGAKAILEVLDTEIADQATLYKQVAIALISKVGGSAGPLYGSAFLAMAGPEHMLDKFSKGLEAIESRGKAVPGEKTMVDMWDAFLNEQTMAHLDKAIEAITAMKATKGRASYVGERSIGHMDPGAMSSYLMFETYLEVFS